MLNEDGYSVKGCKLIYAPEGQAGEYSRLALNDYRGCDHRLRVLLRASHHQDA